MQSGIWLSGIERIMKKTLASLLMLSCLSGQAYAQTSIAEMASSAASAEIQAAAQPSNPSMPLPGNPGVSAPGAQAGATTTAGNLQTGQAPTMTQGLDMFGKPIGGAQEPQVNMTYDKKSANGEFYGTDLPPRVFNNVESDW